MVYLSPVTYPGSYHRELIHDLVMVTVAPPDLFFTQHCVRLSGFEYCKNSPLGFGYLTRKILSKWRINRTPAVNK